MRQTSSSRYAAVDDPANAAADHAAAPVVMLPCAVATDSALGRAMARTFAGAGWDICVYFDVRRPGERADAEHCCAAVASLGRRAVALPVDIPGLGHSSGASALIARCADIGEGLGRLPRCLVNAPAEIDSEAMAATPMRIADGDVAPNIDGSILLRLTEVNVAPALALSQAFHRAWRHGCKRTLTQAETGADVEIDTDTDTDTDTDAPDLAVINMIDSGAAGLGDVAADQLNAAIHLLDQLAFALTQASLRAATPLLAKALAPRVRVAGVSTRLVPLSAPGHATAHDAEHTFELSNAVCEAVLFLADASTITGSILLADGGAHLHRAALNVGPSVGSSVNPSAGQAAGRQSVASMSDAVPEIASDPHGE